jgi:hypothetical protein
VTSAAQIEAAKLVAIQAVCSALQDDGFWSISFPDFANHFLKDIFVGLVVNAILQGEIDGMVLAFCDANVMNIARAGEEFSAVVLRVSICPKKS